MFPSLTTSSPDATSELHSDLRAASTLLAQEESILAPMLSKIVQEPDAFGDVLALLLSQRLACNEVPTASLVELFESIYKKSADLVKAAVCDVHAVLQRDAATTEAISVVLNHKGFHALQAHRAAHELWKNGREALALYLQGLSNRSFAVDIHPACSIGHSAMFDHATGIVIGETCVILDRVSLMQGVTLGGTGKASGDRHPKIGSGVLVGAGAVLLGDILIGENARIGAGSVVLTDVAPYTTVVGVPAKAVGLNKAQKPAEEMDHNVLTLPVSPSFPGHHS